MNKLYAKEVVDFLILSNIRMKEKLMQQRKNVIFVRFLF